MKFKRSDRKELYKIEEKNILRKGIKYVKFVNVTNFQKANIGVVWLCDIVGEVGLGHL